MNSRDTAKVNGCDEACRLSLTCSLNYAVNEYQMLCEGYSIDYTDAWYYLLESLQNPWADFSKDSSTSSNSTTTTTN